MCLPHHTHPLKMKIIPDPPMTPDIREVVQHTPHASICVVSSPRAGNNDQDRGTWAGFKLVGDNQDWRGKPRHQTLDSRGYGFHAFQLTAVEDRINISHLSDKHNKPVRLSKYFHAKSLLSSHDDVITLEKNLCILVARILTQHIPEFQPLSKFVLSHTSQSILHNE